MLRVKGQDGYCPIGPGLVSGVDIRESMLRTYINGAVVQEGPIAEMTFPIDYILADLCRHITLLPGDVILTGTPANSRPMQLDDVVEVEVTGVGRLTNTVAECPRPATRWATRRSRTPRASCGWPTAVTGGPSGTPRRQPRKRPSTPCRPRRDVLSPS